MNRKQQKERLKYLNGQAGKIRDRHNARLAEEQKQADEAMERWRVQDEVDKAAAYAMKVLVNEKNRARLAYYNLPKTTLDAW